VWEKESLYNDSAATGRPFYIVKEFENYAPRLVLLDNGNLTLANYCKYGEYTVSSDFKPVGIGCVHDHLINVVKFIEISQLKENMGRYEELLLRKQSHILVRTTTSSDTGAFWHKYVSGKELEELLR
jgi:hypothetical protein